MLPKLFFKHILILNNVKVTVLFHYENDCVVFLVLKQRSDYVREILGTCLRCYLLDPLILVSKILIAKK